MRFTDLFIKRPVLASVVSLLILLIGVQAGLKLPVRQYPELSQTIITITTTYPGANADLIKGFITTPIEQAVASTDGVDTLVSSSLQNVSTITLNMRLNANPDRAVADVLSKIQQVKSFLPRDAQDPQVVKQTGQGFALLYLSFNSKQMTAPQITDFLSRVVQPKLQTLEGVANAQILGGQPFAMRIWLDPLRMAARQVTPIDVRNALSANNFTSAAGQIKSEYTQTTINAKTSLEDAAAFANLVIYARGDALVRLGDVAEIALGPQSVDSSSVFDGLKAVFIGVYATPTANPLEVIDRVRKAFPDIQAQLPPSLQGALAYDATEFIRASIDEVVKTLGEAAIIVILVIFLFLGDLRATLIPLVTIPLSLVGVMIALLALGYSLNLLTLLALVLAIGLVVDDAIVVVENIWRHLEDGLAPKEASLLGAREIAGPVVSMTITLAAVYAPIGFVSGLTGALFREFAFTLAGAVAVSGVVALTLSPMMCSKLFSARHAKKTGFAAFLDRLFEKLRQRYERRLHNSLNFRALTFVVLTGIVALTGVMVASTPTELAPDEDQGFLLSFIKTPQYANLDYLERASEEFRAVADQIPEKSHLFQINGVAGVHQGLSGLLLKPWGERKRNHKQILQQDLQQNLPKITGAAAFSFSPPALPGSAGGPPLQFVVRSTGDYLEIARVVDEIQKAATQSGMFIFTDVDLRFDTPQIEVAIDAGKANRLGLSMQDVGGALATLLGGNYVNRFALYGRSYQVIPQAPRAYRDDAQWLSRYQLRSASGELVPLSSFSKITHSVQPNALNAFQQLNSATLSGVPLPGRTMGEAVEFLKKTSQKIFPEGFTYDFQGESRQYVQESGALLAVFAFALVVIFLVLAAQFESFRDPLIVLIALPTAMFGALLPLNILGVMGLASLNIYSEIGLVTLIGLISKHGILMVEFANQLQVQEGLDRRAAIEKAAGVRLRPILMTTAAMFAGMIPLIAATGAGAQSRIAIGMVIASGVAIGTFFTLFVTPAVYSVLAGDHRINGAADHPAA